MIAGRRGSAQSWIGSAILRLLLTPALARNLRVAATENRVVGTHLDRHIRREPTLNPLASYIIFKTRRSPFARRVVEHALLSNRRKRHHRVNSQRLPRLQ